MAGARLALWRADSTLDALPPSPFKAAVDEFRDIMPEIIRDARRPPRHASSSAVIYTPGSTSKISLVLQDRDFGGDLGKRMNLVRKDGDSWSFFETEEQIRKFLETGQCTASYRSNI
eukprot:jgi/Hompol1/3484/HPOL_006562-RA